MPIFRVALDNASVWSGVWVDSSLRGAFTLFRTTRRAHDTNATRIPVTVQMQLRKVEGNGEARDGKNDAAGLSNGSRLPQL